MAEPLSFLENLNQDQTDAAIAVAEKAKAMGINPRLALSIAYREGKLDFNTKDGADGEIGVMQVKPSTARLLGFTEKDLRDPQKNVEIGLTYLKQGLDKFNDPVTATAGYNAGMDHKFFEDPEKHSLPESTVNYLKDIKSYGGFTQPAPQVEEGAPEEAPPAPASEEDFGLSRAKQMFNNLTPLDVGEAAGAATGAYLGPKIGGALESIQKAATRPTGGELWAKNWAGQDRPGVSVPEASAGYQRSKGQGKITGRITQMYGPRPPVEPGVFQPGRLSLPESRPPIVTPLGSKIMQYGSAILNSPLGKVATGALGGYGTVAMGSEASERSKRGDTAGASIAGAGALGSALAAIPTPFTRTAGAALGTASPAALWMLEHSRKMSPENAQGVLQRTDPMGNPIP